MTLIRIKRGLEINRTKQVPKEGEPLFTTDEHKLYVGDGVTAGGIPVDTNGGGGGGDVASVNGKTGVVVLNASDVGADPAGSATTAQNNAKTYTDIGLDDKVDKVAGRGLSTNDYTTTEKNKLAGIASGAQVNTVTSVNGKTGGVTLTKADIGLTSVDNTSDVSKPISTPTKTYVDNGLNGKEDSFAKGSLVAGSNVILSGTTANRLVGAGNVTITATAGGGGGGGGDMFESVYDPSGIQNDAFSQDNMKDGSINKNYTATEQSKLSGIEAGAEVNTVSQSDIQDVQDDLGAHEANTSNPHSVTKAQVGLGSVPNLDTTTAVNQTHTHSNKATLDATTASYTSAEKSKLSGIEAGAQVNTVSPSDLATKQDTTTLLGALPTTVGSNNQIIKVVSGVPTWSADANTTYSEVSEAEIDAGTASTLRAITGRRVQYILDKVTAWLNGKFDKTGGQITGAVGINKVPAAGRTLDVDGDIYSNGGKVPAVTVNTTAPASPKIGDIWVEV